MYGDGKVIKRRLVEGKGDFPIDCPMEDCQVHFAYKARRALVGVKGETWAFDSCESSEVLHVDLGELLFVILLDFLCCAWHE